MMSANGLQKPLTISPANKFACAISLTKCRWRHPKVRRPCARALQDQVRALEHLSTLTNEATRGHDVTRPRGVAPARPQGPATSLTRSYEANTPPSGAGAGGNAPASSGSRWSFGDLLARASQDDEASSNTTTPGGPSTQSSNFELNIRQMAGALDPATAASLWSRLRVGHTNVMTRGIYTPDGQALFDTLSARLRTDVGLQNTVSRFLEDFRRIQQDTERKDPSGQLTKNQLLSDTGRVYLFLAHASGRIS